MLPSNYNEIKFLSRGAHGSCYLCERTDDVLQTKVVIKKIPLTDPEKQKEEIKILSRFRHPFIVGFFETFVDSIGNMNIVMQYMEGGNLADFLHERSLSIPRGYLSDEEVADYLGQVTMALEYLHRNNIIHRDLKPDNILMNASKKILKVADFGISKEMEDSGPSKTFIGTSNYVAPEMYMGRSYDKTVDIWALGCVLYELTELERAFSGCHAALVNNILKASYSKPKRCTNPILLQIMLDCLSVTPERRPKAKDILASPVVLVAIGRICSMCEI